MDISINNTARAAALLLAAGALALAAPGAGAAEEKGKFDRIPAPAAPAETVGPDWKDTARRVKHAVALRMLPDLEARAELSDDPCRLLLSVRNNSLTGLSMEQWENPEDTVRVELWSVDEARFDDEHNLTFREVDPFGNLRNARGEGLQYTWDVDPGSWQVRLYVDVTRVVPELTEENNEAYLFTFCRGTE